MVPAESSLLCSDGGGAYSGQRHVCGGCGFSERLSFMRLLQQVHDFSAVSQDDDDDNDAFLGSDRNNKDNKKVTNNYQDCRRDHNHNIMADRDQEPRTSGSSSKDNTNTNTETTDLNQAELREEAGWLRLGIGGQTEAKPEAKTNNLDLHQHQGDRVVDRTAPRTTDSLLELNLFMGGSAPGRFSNQDQQELRPPLNTSTLGTSLLYNYHRRHHHHNQESSSINNPAHQHHDQELIGPWAFRPPFLPQNLSSSSSNLMMAPLVGPYLPRSHFYQSQLLGTTTSSNYTDVMAMAGPSSGSFRAIDPPRRPRSGIWFVLQASQDQAREPFLPQIPKSYLRIKDGRMTVRLLMKYLVNKLQLEHESQIEIRCRGEQLQPVLTLQHVRDTIWRRRDTTAAAATTTTSHPHHFTLLPNSSTSDHLMVLHYGRSL